MSTPTVTIYCDGITEPRNPGGWACWAWIAINAGGNQIASDYGCLGHGAGMTNNLAEYHAVLSALEYAIHQRWHHVYLCTDSKLVVEQVNGRWACNAPALQPLCTKAQQLVALV